MVQKSSYPPVDMVDMDVSENSGTPKSSILIGFSIIFTIHFGVPLFLETPISTIKIYKALSTIQKAVGLGDFWVTKDATSYRLIEAELVECLTDAWNGSNVRISRNHGEEYPPGN